MLLIEFIIISAVFLLLLLAFIKMRRDKDKGMGGFTTISAGATYEAMNADQKRAVDEVIEQKSGKKLEDQSSSEPSPEPNPNNMGK